jgi:hypothetical protein
MQNLFEAGHSHLFDEGGGPLNSAWRRAAASAQRHQPIPHRRSRPAVPSPPWGKRLAWAALACTVAPLVVGLAHWMA